MPASYVLYGSEHSLYTGKARAFLRFKGVPFEERPATRDVYKTIILPRVGAPIIPVLATADDHYVQDTTEIIDYIEARHPQPSVYPQGAVQRLVALLLELFGDEWLVIPAMHYRWSVLDQQHDFIMREFGRLSLPDASPEEQIAIGERVSRPFSGMVGVLGITPDTIPGIEAAYLEFLAQLDHHLSQHDFLLGSRPSIGDYGFMGPLYAHLARDPVPLALMQERAPNVYAWVERMNAPGPDPGEFLPDDDIPETLLPILEALCRDQLPDVQDVIARNSHWLADNPGGDIPRFLGMHPFTFGDASGERVISSYAQWMFQRAWAHYQDLEGSDLDRANALLDRIGGRGALEAPVSHWLERKKGQLELVASEPVSS